MTSNIVGIARKQLIHDVRGPEGKPDVDSITLIERPSGFPADPARKLYLTNGREQSTMQADEMYLMHNNEGMQE
jgi:hypothetical protein